MLALSSLALAAMLSLSPAARAGSWTFTCNGSGSNDDVSAAPGQPDHHTPWTSPGPQTGSFSLPQFGSSSSYRSKNTVSVTVTVKATWNPGPSSDPAPPAVWLCESASAEWSAGSSGSASDGLGPEYKLNPSGGGIASSADAPASTPPAYWKKYTVSGGSVTLPSRTLKAEADFPPTASWPYGNTCTAYIDSYRVTVHAQPYNFRLGAYVDNSGLTVYDGVGYDNQGQIHFHYIWDSTSGNLSNLTDCVVYEHLSSLGNSTGSYYTDAQGNQVYAPLNPPFNYTVFQTDDLPDPKGQNPTRGTAGYQDDYLYRQNIVSPYRAASYSVTQDWQFNDAATGETHVELLGPFTITRTVFQDFASTTHPWSYSVSKGSYSNTYRLP